jgi:chaperonin cofactor prefoldin
MFKDENGEYKISKLIAQKSSLEVGMYLNTIGKFEDMITNIIEKYGRDTTIRVYSDYGDFTVEADIPPNKEDFEKYERELLQQTQNLSNQITKLNKEILEVRALKNSND